MSDTRDCLLQAFANAMMAGPYDKITVADVLTRAGVGRTTFYAHFRSKDELLAHSVDALRGWLEEAAQARLGRRCRARPVARDGRWRDFGGGVGVDGAAHQRQPRSLV
jgi:AcrR family transcriptional regulator